MDIRKSGNVFPPLLGKATHPEHISLQYFSAVSLSPHPRFHSINLIKYTSTLLVILNMSHQVEFFHRNSQVR